MTTFKNNARYGELILSYLDVAFRGDTPLTVEEVLKTFVWKFKGGSLREAAEGTELKPEVSESTYPHGLSCDFAAQWPDGVQCLALRQLLANRRATGKLRARGVMARLGTYMMLTSSYGGVYGEKKVYSGMRAIYHVFGQVWEWARKYKPSGEMGLLEEFTRELTIGASACCKVYMPAAEENRAAYWAQLSNSRVPALLVAVRQLKEIVTTAGSREAAWAARVNGTLERERWPNDVIPGLVPVFRVGDLEGNTRCIMQPLGPGQVRVSQACALWGTGLVRYALGKSDMERLHQLTMAATSALVGVMAQAALGTLQQKRKARLAVEVAEENISRIVRSSRLVPLGDEVLVCKGYRRAYTAHLGWLAGPLCKEEMAVLIQEAEETAGKGVLDVEGMLIDARTLDAASSLNATKMFKICPAPDVSPGYALMDRVKQIGDGNKMDPGIVAAFTTELRSQILRAYIRSTKTRLKVRPGMLKPLWYRKYLEKDYDMVPTAELHSCLAWEGTATMPDVTPYDPKHWKDSGLGADTIQESMRSEHLGYKGNMLTRLVFDDDCPMPGSTLLNDEHVIKFFVKAEGHKDPARGIYSANLRDRQAQSWMEKAVEKVAIKHPSFMIGQEVDVKNNRVAQLTNPPGKPGWTALYYSFDISGWSAKMPAEPQRISHAIWADLYGGHLFRKAAEINEGAHIYLNMDGYTGWFKNTHANLEGFNGKEMTMVLIALLSLSVRVWRERVVDQGLLPKPYADETVALLFAYIDDGLCRIDLPTKYARGAFRLYKETVVDTFSRCGYSVEVSKCFPSDRFAIFLNEVYLAGRHVVHGVRAAMNISAEPTERHTTLTERVGSVCTSIRGAVMAGLSPLSGVFLMAYHLMLHIIEWVLDRDPVVLAVWCVTPRAWGGLGIPNLMQLFVSGSGSAFEESVASLQAYARHNKYAKNVFLKMAKTTLEDRTPVSVLTAPLSCKVTEGYMVDSRIASAVRNALEDYEMDGKLSTYAERLLKYANPRGFSEYAEAVVALCPPEVIQEQMLNNVAEAHPHHIFSQFASRIQKSTTVQSVLGYESFKEVLARNRTDAAASLDCLRGRIY